MPVTTKAKTKDRRGHIMSGNMNLETLRKSLQVLIIPLAFVAGAWVFSMERFRTETQVEHETMKNYTRELASGLKSLQAIATENAQQVGILLDRENRRTN